MRKYNPRHEKRFNRRSKTRVVKQSFVIVCEGVNTEPEYFKAFRLTSANIKALGKGLSTMRLVEEAVIVKQIEERKRHRFDQYWVVFDKDQATDEDFNSTIRLAEKNGFCVAYSNQAFEYWFLLHFNLYQGHIHRNQYEKILSKESGMKYNKRESFITQFFHLLKPKQADEIKRAKTILKSFENIQPAKAESSTTVHLLVSELNKYR